MQHWKAIALRPVNKSWGHIWLCVRKSAHFPVFQLFGRLPWVRLSIVILLHFVSPGHSQYMDPFWEGNGNNGEMRLLQLPRKEFIRSPYFRINRPLLTNDAHLYFTMLYWKSWLTFSTKLVSKRRQGIQNSSLKKISSEVWTLKKPKGCLESGTLGLLYVLLHSHSILWYLRIL